MVNSGFYNLSKTIFHKACDHYCAHLQLTLRVCSLASSKKVLLPYSVSSQRLCDGNKTENISKYHQVEAQKWQLPSRYLLYKSSTENIYLSLRETAQIQYCYALCGIEQSPQGLGNLPKAAQTIPQETGLKFIKLCFSSHVEPGLDQESLSAVV